MCTIKTLPGVDTSLTGDYKIRAEDGLEMFNPKVSEFIQKLSRFVGCRRFGDARHEWVKRR